MSVLDRSMTTADKFREEWSKASNNWTYQPLYGDSVANCGRRVKKALIDSSSNSQVEAIGVVSHGGAICDLLRVTAADQLRELVLTDKEYQVIPLASVTTIDISDDGWTVVDVGATIAECQSGSDIR